MQKVRSLNTGRRVTYAAFVAPALLLYLIVVVVPFFQGIPYSLTNWNGISQTYDFVGLKNYQRLLKAKEFWTSIRNTFQYTFFYIVFSNVIGLAVALLLKKSTRLNNVSRTVIFMPYVVSMLTAAFVWKYIFSSVYSPILNVPSPLGLPSQALMGIVVISVWRASGYCMLIYIAALQGVPQEYYEAASVEGANAFQRFFKITVPLIMPAFSVNVSLLLAWGLKVFDTVMATTNGGPGKATITMAMYIYNNIFGFSKAGYGQAAAVIMTLILLAVSVVVSVFFRKKEVQI